MTTIITILPFLCAVLFKSIWVGVGENRLYSDRGPAVATWTGRLTTGWKQMENVDTECFAEQKRKNMKVV